MLSPSSADHAADAQGRAVITVFRGDRRVIAWQTEQEAIAWCERNKLSDDWKQDYRLINNTPLSIEFCTWALGPQMHGLLMDGDRTLPDIARSLHLDPQAVGVHLREWQTLGWVERCLKPGCKRRYVHRLTEQGRSLKLLHGRSQKTISRSKAIIQALRAGEQSVAALSRRLGLNWHGAWWVVQLLKELGIVEQYGHSCYLREHP